ncbi:MAG: glycoside hydrolase family 3 N-terminal domain-containing protein [candidate division KSB1 bacterium]|nr:glycoside hydrolase family 3 N-terminal domain-containing protein [candidate division KSB1 bacterium]
MKAYDWVESTLRQLSLKQKVGQMFFAAFSGDHFALGTPERQRLESLVKEWQIGGFHIWRGEPYAFVHLANALQKLSRVPLLFEADFEHGTGWRFPGGVDFPPAMAISATGDTTLAYEMGRITGIEARAMGIHLTFSPVVDVNSNPANPIINTRSFGETPEQVERFATAFIRGAHAAHLLTTAKHFPGHGDTGMDSHLSLATIDADSARLYDVELRPFRAAIAAGTDAIMSAHISLTRWPMPPYTPATLSPEILTGLLRKQLGFDGLIFTDAMGMYAVHKNFTEGYATIAAIKAGADIILVSPKLPEAIEAVVAAVNRGDLSEARIDASVRRILRAKARLGLHRQRFVDADRLPERLGTSGAVEIASRAAQKAMTLLRNRDDVVPIAVDLQQKTVHVVMASRQPIVDLGRAFLDKLRPVFPHLQVDYLNDTVSSACFEAVLERAKSADLLILPLFAFVQAYRDGTEFSPEVWDMLDRLLDLPSPAIAIAFGSPYLLPRLEKVEAYLCTYGPTNILQEAAANAILGRAPITGRIPVSLPGSFRRGDGIQVQPQSALKPLAADAPAPRVRIGLPEEAGFKRQGLAGVDSMMQRAVRDSVFPGAVLLVARNGVIAHFKAYGKMGYGKWDRPVPLNAIYDLASLTKVIATTTAAMLMVQSGQLDLDAAVQGYLPRFVGENKGKVTVRHLLTHSSGLPPFKRYFLENLPPGEIIERILKEPLEYEPGTETRYSDLGIILLGKMIEKLSGKPLDQFCRDRIFEPLGMTETFFNPTAEFLDRIPPTENDPWRGRIVHGVVHDENAFALGGVSGHAGLFSSAHDLAIFAQMLLNGGRYDEMRLLKKEIVDAFTRRQELVPGSTRALGWDTPGPNSSGGHYLSRRAFGHTGFTGTSIWIDPERKLFVILLSNRVHPTRKNRKLYRFRPQLHDAILRALQHKGGTDAGQSRSQSPEFPLDF